MTEHLQPNGNRKNISRRELLLLGRNTILAAAGLTTINMLSDGVSLDKPPPDVRKIDGVNRFKEIQFSSEGSPEGRRQGLVTITAEHKLFFEPSGEYFTDDREYWYTHRANSIEHIYRAHKLGANVFDIDANDVDGTVWAEHGVIPQRDMNGRRMKLPMVFDLNEKEIKLGMPKYTYGELVAYIASISTVENPLAIFTEFKHGPFEPETVSRMLDDNQTHDVAVMMYPVETRLLEAMRTL